MITLDKDTQYWFNTTEKLAKLFADYAEEKDKTGTFVNENYELLKTNRFFSLLVPEELGGANLNFSEVCNIIKMIGKHCGSTALAFSMHQHLVAANVWKYIHKGESASILSNISDKQLVMVSTGAKDWLESNGEMKKVEGGYIVSAKKAFASQSVIGDILVTSAPFKNELGETNVLHFGVPFKSENVKLLNDWDVMGMRGTGSQTVVLDKVFVPDSAIALQRPQNEFHNVWNVVITVAMPLIMSAYMGIAERAKDIALETLKSRTSNSGHTPYLYGKLQNTYLSASVQWQAMQNLTNELDFSPYKPATSNMLSLKTNVCNACMETVKLAVELVGGQSYYRKNELERLFRDVQASQFHPLPEWKQYEFCFETEMNI